jgi:hypothetical protein
LTLAEASDSNQLVMIRQAMEATGMASYIGMDADNTSPMIGYSRRVLGIRGSAGNKQGCVCLSLHQGHGGLLSRILLPWGSRGFGSTAPCPGCRALVERCMVGSLVMPKARRYQGCTRSMLGPQVDSPDTVILTVPQTQRYPRLACALQTD